MTSAPAYEFGPYGDQYPPTSSPLWNAGSCTPAENGLYHYTTRSDQVKDGEETGSPNNVNIGLHCVAANWGLYTSPPLDYDGDGIPDYVEDANGNSVWDPDTETDWKNPYTTTDPITQEPIPDSLSSVYDDIDLDGDGLVGRIEKALGTDPMVSDNPLTLTQVTTGEEPTIVTFRVNLDYDLVTSIGELQLMVDGVLASFQECLEDNSGFCLLKWNTTFTPPSYHYNWIYRPFVPPRDHLLQAQLILNRESCIHTERNLFSDQIVIAEVKC